jgi:outer membrane protein TolC
MLHNEVVMIEQRLRSSKAMLNMLLGRAADAPLGAPKPIEPADEPFDAAEIAGRRPELRQAEAAVRKAEASLEAGRKDATLPDFMVGVDYMQPDAWGGMFSITLPWLSPQKGAELRARELDSRAARMGLEALKNQSAFEARDALYRVEAAAKSIRLYREELEPKSVQANQIARTEFETARGTFVDLMETEGQLRVVRLGLAKAVAEHETAAADLRK